MSSNEVEKYWADVASREIEWFEKWDRVLEWNYPHYKWFVGGKLNITHNCLDRHVRDGRGDYIALTHIDEGGVEKRLTYRELLSQVSRAANGLRTLGVKKGDRVAIYMPPMIEQVVAMLASARVGAIHSVIFAGFSDKALRDRLVDLGAKVVITSDWTMRRGQKKELLSTVRCAIDDLNTLEHVIVACRDACALTGREIDWQEFVSREDDECAPEMMDSEDPLFILYTSGSTGRPKGVVHTVGGYGLFAHHTAKEVFGLKPEDVYWCTADLGWITGHSYVAYGPLSIGATSLLVEGVPDFPDKDRWYRLIEKYKVNIFYTSPTAIRMLKRFGDNFLKGRDLSSLRVLGSVGEPISDEARGWFVREMGKGRCAFVDTWWQTETGGHMIVNGKPLPGIEADIVDTEGEGVPAGEDGLLVIRKPWPGAMRTCWRDDDRFRRYWEEIPGVYLAGDIARRDERGLIQVLGRSDDLINVSGHRIGTAEVESALASHSSVAENAVIGKPDEIRGEIVKVFVVLKDGCLISVELVESIKMHVRGEIGAHAVPGEVEFVESLPKTRSGKIMRRVLKARESGRDPGDLSTLED